MVYGAGCESRSAASCRPSILDRVSVRYVSFQETRLCTIYWRSLASGRGTLSRKSGLTRLVARSVLPASTTFGADSGIVS
jgi:hypothetical protein